MGKLLPAAALLLVLCTICSYAEEDVCKSFCRWAKNSDKCDLKDPGYCDKHYRDKVYKANFCGCCKGTCIQMLDENENCSNNKHKHYKLCKDGMRCNDQHVCVQYEFLEPV